jgi:alpha-L-fucosidase
MPQRDCARDLFADCKYGMFMHWGLYSILGRGEWAQYIEKISGPDYAKLAQQFKGEKFDADVMARLAIDAGMKYIVLTAKHHDGFCLFDSKLTDFTTAKTAAGRDFIGEIAEACHKHGLGFHPYYSLWDWHHPGFVPDDAARWQGYLDYYHGQVRELCANYGALSGMWFDTGGGVGPNYDFAKAAAIAHRLQPEAAIMCDDYWVGEKSGQPSADNRPKLQGLAVATLSPGCFEICETVNDHYCCCPTDHNFKSTSYLWHYLLETVGHGGNFLLNIGPQPDGTIDNDSAGSLRRLGKLMRKHGDALYGTRAAVHPRINPNGYTTVRDNRAFFFITNLTPVLDSLFDLGDPLNLSAGEAEVEVNGVRSKVIAVAILGGGASLPYRQEATRLRVTVPRTAMTWPHVVLEVLTDGKAEVDYDIRPEADGRLVLTPECAALYSPTPGEPRYFPAAGGPGHLGMWTDPKARAEWLMRVPAAGVYDVAIEQACPGAVSGSSYTVTFTEPGLLMTRIINHLSGATVEANLKKAQTGVTVLKAKTQPTGGWSDYAVVALGSVSLPAGPVTVNLASTSDRTVFMDMRAIRLVPGNRRPQ